MGRNLALSLFIAACLVVAVLLLAGVIGKTVGAALFALSLVVFGVLSKGFKKSIPPTQG